MGDIHDRISHNNHVVYDDRHFPHMILPELQKSTASMSASDLSATTMPLPRQRHVLVTNTWSPVAQITQMTHE